MQNQFSACSPPVCVCCHALHNAAMDNPLTRVAGPTLILLCVLTACTSDESSINDSPAVVVIDVPSGPDSTSPNLVSGPDGRVVLSWTETDGTGHALKFSTLADNAWGVPGTVSRGESWFVNWADFPSVVPISENLWAAHWLVSQPAGGYAYDVAVSLSADSGQTWSEIITPHRDGTATEHGFVTLYPGDGGMRLIWLDGRNMVNESDEDIVNSGLTLRAASLSASLVLSNESLIDGLVCDCCQTDVAISSKGPVAIYRNRTTAEIRDIYVSRYVEDGWQEGKPMANDNWDIAGCPVNGPAIEADENLVVAAWFTGADDQPRVRASFSEDAAQSFSAPIDVVNGNTLGRVGLAMLSDSDVAVSWLRNTADESSEVCVRRVSIDGELGPVQVISHTDSVSSLSVPQIVRTGDDLVIAWTDKAGDGNRVMSARVPIDML